MPPFYYTALDYFGPFKVKVGRNKTAKHYGVLFTCLDTRFTWKWPSIVLPCIELMTFLRRFFSIQMTGAAKELRDMVNNLKGDQLREFYSERSIHWVFTTLAT